MKIIVAIDSFKGCLTSAEANQAACEGVFAKKPDAELMEQREQSRACMNSAESRQKKNDVQVVQVPVRDGGEGWLEAFHAAMGGEIVEVNVKDPLMRPIVASYLLQGDTAVIEIAKASGLTLLKPEERNPIVATSYGTGQLVVDAVRKGCKHIIVGLGGSATSDCGIGMLRAIVDALAKGKSWDDVHELDDVHFTIATDVTNPLCGENGAAYVFAPQKFAIKREQSELDSIAEREQTRPQVKGATLEQVIALDARAKRFAEVSAKHLGRDCQNMPGAGAAGGLRLCVPAIHECGLSLRHRPPAGHYPFRRFATRCRPRHHWRGLCRPSDPDGQVALWHLTTGQASPPNPLSKGRGGSLRHPRCADRRSHS